MVNRFEDIEIISKILEARKYHPNGSTDMKISDIERKLVEVIELELDLKIDELKKRS